MFAGLALIANTVALAMLERRREIGILKAIGHTSRGILGMVLAEHGILGIVGAYAALLLVSLAATILSQLAFQSATGTSASVSLIVALAGATALLCMLVAGDGRLAGDASAPHRGRSVTNDGAVFRETRRPNRGLGYLRWLTGADRDQIGACGGGKPATTRY